MHVPQRIFRGTRYSPASFWLLAALGLGLPTFILIVGFGAIEMTLTPGEKPPDELAAAITLAAFAPVVLHLVLLYRMWNQIQDGKARTSAALAVALMVIPLVNIYWQFQAFYGLAKDLNAYSDRNGVRGPRTPAWCALLACITMTCLVVPLTLGAIVVIAAPLVGILVLGATYLETMILAPVMGVFGQVAWWFMVAESAAIARVRACAPNLADTQFPARLG